LSPFSQPAPGAKELGLDWRFVRESSRNIKELFKFWIAQRGGASFV